jgi:hypothetical protein
MSIPRYIQKCPLSKLIINNPPESPNIYLNQFLSLMFPFNWQFVLGLEDLLTG